MGAGGAVGDGAAGGVVGGGGAVTMTVVVVVGAAGSTTTTVSLTPIRAVFWLVDSLPVGPAGCFFPRLLSPPEHAAPIVFVLFILENIL